MKPDTRYIRAFRAGIEYGRRGWSYAPRLHFGTGEEWIGFGRGWIEGKNRRLAQSNGMVEVRRTAAMANAEFRLRGEYGQ